MSEHPHDHDHDLTFQPDEEESLGHYAIAEMAMRELLIEKGIIEPDEFRKALEFYDRATRRAGWVGWASKRLSASDDSEKVINEAVAKILRTFPPRAG